MRVPSVGLPSRNQITLVDLREWPHAILKEQIRARLFVAETPVRRVWAWGFRIRENSFFCSVATQDAPYPASQCSTLNACIFRQKLIAVYISRQSTRVLQ